MLLRYGQACCKAVQAPAALEALNPSTLLQPPREQPPDPALLCQTSARPAGDVAAPGEPCAYLRAVHSACADGSPMQAEWLLARLSPSEQQARSLGDSEVASLLMEAQAACQDLGGLQAAELESGHGSAVCTLLMALADKALAAAPPPKAQRQPQRCEQLAWVLSSVSAPLPLSHTVVYLQRPAACSSRPGGAGEGQHCRVTRPGLWGLLS